MKEHLEHMEYAEFMASVTRIRAPGEIDFNDYKKELSIRLSGIVLKQNNPKMLIDYLSDIIHEIREFTNEYDWD